MHGASLRAESMSEAERARCGGPAELAAALQAARRDTLATFAAYEAALPPGLAVPRHAELNPPLWELGHIGWFQTYWIARNPVRAQGVAADPQHPRMAAQSANADALYDSSHVPHETRWSLPLPDADATCAELAQQLAHTLDLLRTSDATDHALYFFRLALLHEDMHHEAALYMARALGVNVAGARWQPSVLPPPPNAIELPAGPWVLGRTQAQGFAFDNELGTRHVDLPAAVIDAQAVRWAEYLPFVEAQGRLPPRYLRRTASGWQQRHNGAWQALNPSEAAVHLNQADAQAWCHWAGRRLPTEAEWERAALTEPERFRWGDVWEWTASPFEPFDGFEPHPYRDYSAPWFDGRPVLRGASFVTQPRMRHVRYRNFFPAQRSDVPAGFRSCAT
jgi:gamma-glutamyl hercynylcysteine S-oxide synthase